MFLEYQVAFQNFANDMLRRLKDAREDERGQTFVEWLGVMAVIVVVVGLVAGQASTVQSAITGVITHALQKIQSLI
jgi:ABC-type antimicrobial peptide transport system permease subunit